MIGSIYSHQMQSFHFAPFDAISSTCHFDYAIWKCFFPFHFSFDSSFSFEATCFDYFDNFAGNLIKAIKDISMQNT